jgi:hypothetical protein
VLIAGAGLEATYALDAATFGFSLVVLTMMRTPPAPADAGRRRCAPSPRGSAMRARARS